MRFVLLAVLLACVVGCECNASDLPEKECLNLEEIMRDPKMKGSEVCKFMENFCVFTSPQKATRGDMTYTLSHQIPCHQFDKMKVIASRPTDLVVYSSK